MIHVRVAAKYVSRPTHRYTPQVPRVEFLAALHRPCLPAGGDLYMLDQTHDFRNSAFFVQMK